MMKPMKKIALLHSMCSVGKASMTNMIPILSTMGVETCPFPTVLLSTHTGGYGIPAIQKVSIEYICNSAKHYRENGVTFDMIFVGYLGSVEMAEATLYFISQFPEAIILLDPIMGDHGKFYTNMGPDYAMAYQKLIPYADVMLPNLTEACLLTGKLYSENLTEEDIAEICTCLKEKGAKQIVITSVPNQHDQKNIAIATEKGMEILAFSEVKEEFHGSGDVFDAVVAGYYMKKMNLKECIEKAHIFVCECIKESAKPKYPEREGLMVEKMLSLLV